MFSRRKFEGLLKLSKCCSSLHPSLINTLIAVMFLCKAREGAASAELVFHTLLLLLLFVFVIVVVSCREVGRGGFGCSSWREPFKVSCRELRVSAIRSRRSTITKCSCPLSSLPTMSNMPRILLITVNFLLFFVASFWASVFFSLL